MEPIIFKMQALCKLATAFDAKFPEARQEIYLDALECYSPESISWACDEAIKLCDFFPVPAQIIELAKQAPRKRLPPEQRLDYTPEQHEDASARFDELAKMFKNWGNV